MLYIINWSDNPMFPKIEERADGQPLHVVLWELIRFHLLIITDHIREAERLLLWNMKRE